MNEATLPQFHGVNGNSPVDIDQFTLPKGIPGFEALAGAKLVDGTGNVMGYDKQDALYRATALQRAAAAGYVQRKFDRATASAAMAAASEDPQAWMALAGRGAAMVNEVNKRVGFLRTLFDYQDLSDGEYPHVSMPTHDVVAVVATGPGTVGTQEITDRRYQPVEYTINTSASVTSLEIKRDPGDALQRLYDQSIEAAQTREDRMARLAMLELAKLRLNEPILLASALTPVLLAQAVHALTQQGLVATNILLAADLWKDIVGNSDFHSAFDPITRYEIVLTGRITQVYGATIITDGLRKENQRVLQPGEIFVTAAKENLGVFTDRGGLEATATDGAVVATSNRGWYMQEHFSLTAPNGRAVQYLRRV